MAKKQRGNGWNYIKDVARYWRKKNDYRTGVAYKDGEIKVTFGKMVGDDYIGLASVYISLDDLMKSLPEED